MAQPAPYRIEHDFSVHTAVDREALDTELGNIRAVLDNILVNLALIQRDDGRIANDAVHRLAMTRETLSLFAQAWNPRGEWVASVDYAKRDTVTSGGQTYLCIVAHTSGTTFAGDYAHGEWMDITAGQVGPQGPQGDAWPSSITPRASNFAITADEHGSAWTMDATGGAREISLPPIAGLPDGWSVTAAKSDTSGNSVRVIPDAGDTATIDGAAQVSLLRQRDFATFIVDQGQWHSIGSNGALPIALPLSIANGGTGGSDAATARGNLGLGTAAVLDAGTGPNTLVQRDSAGNIPGTGSSGVAAIINGGTGASTAGGARTNLGLGSAAELNVGLDAGDVLVVTAGAIAGTAVIRDAAGHVPADALPFGLPAADGDWMLRKAGNNYTWVAAPPTVPSAASVETALQGAGTGGTGLGGQRLYRTAANEIYWVPDIDGTPS